MSDEKKPASEAPGVSFGSGKMAFGVHASGNALRALEDRPNPFDDVEYTGNVEEDAAAELSALEKAYRERAKREDDRFVAATDSEFWFAVCFQSRSDKEAFLKKYDLIHLGDKYLDGDVMDGVLSS